MSPIPWVAAISAADYALHRAVHDDVSVAWEDLRKEDTPVRRRAYVRVAFAAIEALTYVLKQDALRRAADHPDRYSAAELALLREESYALNSKGEAYIATKFLRVPENFRFAVDMIMRGLLPGFRLHVGVKEWESLKRGLAVRNRIVHPKCETDLNVTDGDLADVHAAFFWVNRATVRSLVQALDVLLSEKGEEPSPRLDEIRRRWQLMLGSDAHDA